MSANIDLVVRSNATMQWSNTLLADDGQPIDITLYTFRMKVRGPSTDDVRIYLSSDDDAGSTPDTSVTIDDGAAGAFSARIEVVELSTLLATYGAGLLGEYDYIAILEDGITQELLAHGLFILQQGQTR